MIMCSQEFENYLCEVFVSKALDMQVKSTAKFIGGYSLTESDCFYVLSYGRIICFIDKEKDAFYDVRELSGMVAIDSVIKEFEKRYSKNGRECRNRLIYRDMR